MSDDLDDLIARAPTLNDEELLAKINVFDPYDVEFARRFRTQAARIADLERQLAEAREVKPLEWVDVEAICTREKAPAFCGHYSLVEFDAGTEDAHFAVNIDLGGLAFVFILEPDPLGGRRPMRFANREAAKAAAQADYTARILSALKGTP